MFAKIVGRRATAVATTLAVVVGLAITPALTAAADEGDAITPTIEQVVETAPSLPVEEAPAPPTEEKPAPPAAAIAPAPPADEKSGPVDEATPPVQNLMRSSAPEETSSLMGIQSVSISPATIGTQIMGQPIDIQFSIDANNVTWAGAYFSTLDLSEDGRLTGTISTPGTRTITVNAYAPGWLGWPTLLDSTTYTFDVVPAIFTSALPGATTGVAYNQTLDATRASGAFRSDSFSVVSGALPPGLSLGASSGKITGTVAASPGNIGTHAFSIQLTSKYLFGSSVASAPKPLSITVGYPAPVVTTTTIPDATVGATYPGAQLQASGGGTITWTATGLPAGLTLDAATGAISGNPSYDASYGSSTTLNFTATANNGSDSAPQTVSVTILTPKPEFGSNLLPAATVGVAYDQALPVSNAFGALSYELRGNTVLPAGLSLTADGRITGTPSYNATAGASTPVNFRVRVTGTAGTDTRNLTIVLKTPAPTIDTVSLAEGWLKQSYNQPIVTTGPGVVITVSGLPYNLWFDGNSIVGTPRVSDVFLIRVTATNTADTVTSELFLQVYDKPELYSAGTAKIETGELYRTWVGYSGQDVTLSLGADAPSGMTINQNGRIKWTPSAPGTYKFTVKATNLSGTDKQKFTIKVFDAPVITQGDLDQGVVNLQYRDKVQHDGTNVKFAIVQGSLPDGLTLTKKGVIKGVATESGTFAFKVRAQNPVGVDREWFTLTVTELAMQLSSTNVIRGKSLTVSGSGYLPGDSIELWLHSTPVLLGTVTAADGTFTSTVLIPANTPAGQHHLVVTGLSGTQSVPLTVATPVVPQRPAPQQSAQQPSNFVQAPDAETTVADQVEPTEEAEVPEEAEEELPTLDKPETAGDAEPAAPSDWSGLVTAAFVLLLAALLVLFLLWRRRRSAES